MVLSHNLATVITISLLLLWGITDKLNVFSKTKSNYLNYVILFGVLAITYWIYNAYSVFFNQFILSLTNLIFTSTTLIPTINTNIPVSTYDLITSEIPDIILIIFSLIFVFYIIDNKKYKKILSNDLDKNIRWFSHIWCFRIC